MAGVGVGKRWAAVMLLLILAFIMQLPSEPVDIDRPAREWPFALEVGCP